MEEYSGELIKRDKQFYIGRYIGILRKVQYPRIDEYIAYGDDLWEKIRDLPRGYCHGDMYDGNIRKTPDGKLYIHDFDTSCEGFPMYDTTLICDMTSILILMSVIMISQIKYFCGLYLSTENSMFSVRQK